MEKRKPTYELDSFKSEFCSVERLRMTGTARNTAFALGFVLQDVVDVIQAMTRQQFYKSMTSLADVKVWQDVYHVPYSGLVLYVKLTVDDEGKFAALLQGEMTMRTKAKNAKNATTKRCPECGGAMRYETRADRVEYKGKVRTFDTTAWWCDGCGESIQEGPALQAAERAFIELRAQVDDVLLPEEVAEVREKLGISQREAGRVLGGGPRAFQKYESGKVPVSGPMKNLLVLLDNDPKRLRELRAQPPRPRGRRKGTSAPTAT